MLRSLFHYLVLKSGLLDIYWHSTFQKGLQLYKNKHYEDAFKIWEPIAKQGHTAAQCNLGLIYQDGLGINQDYSKSIEWYLKAAKQRHAIAQCNLALIYERKGAYRNLSEAIKWFTMSAEQGHIPAQFNLAGLYEAENNYSAALKWYEKAANQGDDTIQAILATIYYNGKGVPQNYSKAFQWYSKAAEQGHVEAQVMLASMYETGEGIKQDYKEALKWYIKAAEQGHIESQFKLGNIFYNGENVPQNFQEASKWYTKVALQGRAEAQYNLGLLYNNDQNPNHNYIEAIKWLTKAAEQGNRDAQYNLGSIYEGGKSVPQDFTNALHWYTKAAEQNDVVAQGRLGKMYLLGEGITENPTEAIKWLTKAYEQGNDDAKKILEQLHYLITLDSLKIDDFEKELATILTLDDHHKTSEEKNFIDAVVDVKRFCAFIMQKSKEKSIDWINTIDLSKITEYMSYTENAQAHYLIFGVNSHNKKIDYLPHQKLFFLINDIKVLKTLTEVLFNSASNSEKQILDYRMRIALNASYLTYYIQGLEIHSLQGTSSLEEENLNNIFLITHIAYTSQLRLFTKKSDAFGKNIKLKMDMGNIDNLPLLPIGIGTLKNDNTDQINGLLMTKEMKEQLLSWMASMQAQAMANRNVSY